MNYQKIMLTFLLGIVFILQPFTQGYVLAEKSEIERKYLEVDNDSFLKNQEFIPTFRVGLDPLTLLDEYYEDNNAVILSSLNVASGDKDLKFGFEDYYSEKELKEKLDGWVTQGRIVIIDISSRQYASPIDADQPEEYKDYISEFYKKHKKDKNFFKEVENIQPMIDLYKTELKKYRASYVQYTLAYPNDEETESFSDMIGELFAQLSRDEGIHPIIQMKFKDKKEDVQEGDDKGLEKNYLHFLDRMMHKRLEDKFFPIINIKLLADFSTRNGEYVESNEDTDIMARIKKVHESLLQDTRLWTVEFDGEEIAENGLRKEKGRMVYSSEQMLNILGFEMDTEWMKGNPSLSKKTYEQVKAAGIKMIGISNNSPTQYPTKDADGEVYKLYTEFFKPLAGK